MTLMPIFPSQRTFWTSTAKRSTNWQSLARLEFAVDPVSRRFLQRNVTGKTAFDSAADHAAVLVICPAGAKAAAERQGLPVDGTVIDYSILTSTGSAAPRMPAEEAGQGGAAP